LLWGVKNGRQAGDDRASERRWQCVPRTQPTFFPSPWRPRASSLSHALSPPPSPPSVSAHAGDDPGFIRVVNGAFVDEGCNEFLFSGYNTFEVRGEGGDGRGEGWTGGGGEGARSGGKNTNRSTPNSASQTFLLPSSAPPPSSLPLPRSSRPAPRSAAAARPPWTGSLTWRPPKT